MHSPFDEDKNRPNREMNAVEFTRWTASQKGIAVVEDLKNNMHPPDFVISADTVVIHQGQILGKPKSADDAKQMLKL